MSARHIIFGGKVPSVGPGAWVAPTAVLAGSVQVDQNASVWFGAVLRADGDTITVGPGSNIQDGAIIHADPGLPVTVGAGVSVGHGAVLHGCSVGDGALIGMRATVLNGAVIGPECLVAAGSVVLEGTQFDEGSLIAGVPAQRRRALTEEERAHLRDNATQYVTLARTYSEAT